MAIFDYTLLQLRHDLAEHMDDLITGTVVSPSSGSFVCAETDWQKGTDYFKEYIEMYCYDGAGVGVSGKPLTFNSTSHTLTFAPAYTLTAGDLVEMHRRFNVARYNRAINQAIEIVASEALQNKVDTSLTLVSGTYQYTLPSDFTHIYFIDLESATAGLYDSKKHIPMNYYRIIPGSTTKIEFVRELFTIIPDRHLRITGLASPSILDTDDEECPINPVYVINQAGTLLHQSLIRASASDTEYHSQQMQLCQAMADKVRNAPGFKTSIGGAISVIES